MSGINVQISAEFPFLFELYQPFEIAAILASLGGWVTLPSTGKNEKTFFVVLSEAPS